MKYNSNGKVEIESKKKETAIFHDKKFILEESITGDFSLIKAAKQGIFFLFRFIDTCCNSSDSRKMHCTEIGSVGLYSVGNPSPNSHPQFDTHT